MNIKSAREFTLSSDILPSGYTHEVYDELGSTMDSIDTVMYDEFADRRHGLVVQALRQTSGQTSSPDRQWQSPLGNLYFSMLVYKGDAHARMISLLAAFVVMETIKASELAAGRLALKLPNDVMIDGRKVCGILALAHPKDTGWCNLGIGVNVHRAPVINDGRNKATCLAEHGWPEQKPAQDFLAAFLNRFETEYQKSLHREHHVLYEMGVIGDKGRVRVKTSEGGELRARFNGIVTVNKTDCLSLGDNRYFPLAISSVQLNDRSWTLAHS